MLCPGKGLVLPTLTVDQIAAHSRVLLISLPNKEMSNKSPFAIHKAILGIGGEPKSIKRLRSGDLLIETISDLQTKSFLLAKTFLNSPVNVSPHKTLNSCRGVISEPDLLSTPESEILEDCSLAQKCVNCSQPHSSDSKQCPKWKAEKEIQAIKTNRNISYLEARKLIAPQLSQTYAQVAKPSTFTRYQENLKSPSEKTKKEILKKMKDTVFEIKMAQHRSRKPASVEYTTDEEDTIVYDMGEEIESPKNGSTVGESKRILRNIHV
ncbi:putative RNA-directed DNA polymerase from transposon BS [Trichonephila clavipes]|nr:putative RNA-directed DNA polymerase from transposon BS [Trichonephila clavipes]